jgi:hypothetical protein
MKAFSYGTALLAILLITSFIMRDYSILMEVGGVIGIVTILLAGVATGAGPAINLPLLGFLFTQYKEESIKTNPSILIFLFGLPNLTGALLTFIVLK